MVKNPRSDSPRVAVPRLLVGLLLGIAVLLAPAVGARGATVSGLVTEYSGEPGRDRQIHFENRVSGDIFLAPTGEDGSFSVNLPPGTYDLRGERGVVIKARITVDREPINLGTVREPPPLDVRRPFQRRGIAETVIETPAPATANIGSGATRAKDQTDAATAPQAPAPSAESAPPADK
jgi:hypothetical protein